MQNQFAENWSKLCQTVSKPMIDMVELNINTLNNLTNTGVFDKIAQAKKPEDFLAAQTELLNKASTEVSKYAQKACTIGLDAITQANKIWIDMFQEVSAKATDVIKTGAKMREKDHERDK